MRTPSKDDSFRTFAGVAINPGISCSAIRMLCVARLAKVLDVIVENCGMTWRRHGDSRRVRGHTAGWGSECGSLLLASRWGKTRGNLARGRAEYWRWPASRHASHTRWHARRVLRSLENGADLGLHQAADGRG